MTEWVLTRWRRYGQDRIYARTPGGTQLGYLDRKTKELYAEQPSDLPLLEAALAEYLKDARSSNGKHGGRDPGFRRSGEPAGEVYIPRHETVDWQDLSNASPGSAAREQALALRKAAPIRTIVNQLLGSHTDERAWRIGADGEVVVADQLSQLGQSWRVNHAVPVGDRGSDIDHVVIGPPGVFTVNSKHHPDAKIWVAGDTFLVNGQHCRYVRNSRHEAARASRLLEAAAGRPIRVQGVIAVVGARGGFTVKEQPRDGAVHVVGCGTLTDYLTNLQPRLSTNDVEALHTLACRSTTWRPSK